MPLQFVHVSGNRPGSRGTKVISQEAILRAAAA